jgi:hypothetical protein
MSDLVALAQEIVRWQKNLAEHEQSLLHFQKGIVKHQKEQKEGSLPLRALRRLT